jgi:hypothetical protein
MCIKCLKYLIIYKKIAILVHSRKNFRNSGTHLIQLHYILVSFYDFSFYDPVLLEPSPVVKRVLPVSVARIYGSSQEHP